VPASPLVPAPVEPGKLPSPALFDVAAAERLPAIVAELRRLGGGSIAVRWPEGEPSCRAFLLVESPPFHTVIRGDPPGFYEQAPRVWVEIGWRHSHVISVEPPAGQMALLRPPARYEFVPDGPSGSGPESFLLPERPIAPDVDANLRLCVKVRLVPDSSAEPAKLWVLRGDPMEQLREFAEQADDREIARLSVAVGVDHGESVAVLRARRGSPPVLVLDALACRPVLRLPNLFAPVGMRLRPSLCRDAIRKLLAADDDTIAWLTPTADGAFTVHRIGEAAFRPMTEVIAYTQDHKPVMVAPAACELPFPPPAFVADERSVPAKKARPSTVPPPSAASPPTPEEPRLLTRVVRWLGPRHGDSTHPGPPPEAKT
jgi:hypothetical protein